MERFEVFFDVRYCANFVLDRIQVSMSRLKRVFEQYCVVLQKCVPSEHYAPDIPYQLVRQSLDLHRPLKPF